MESVVPRPPLPARQIGHREARAGPGPLKWKRRTRVLQPNNAPQFRPRLRPEHPETSLMGSTTAACLRLLSDLKAITQEPPEGCSASPTSEENLFVWTATVFGPDETIWEGGIFCLRITFNENYPEKPPRIRFTTEIFHPNVYSDGTICLDIIQDQWSPCHNVCTILTSIQSLLMDPNCSSPANPEAASLFLSNQAEYNRRVRRVSQRSLDC